MNVLPKDILFNLATKMELPELLKWCSSSKRINDKVCRNNNIWNYKLLTEFPNYDRNLNRKTSRETYFLLYSLAKIRNVFNLNMSLRELYEKPIINQIYQKIKEIPKEIGVLVNLEELYLYGNEIEEIPKELSKLSKLRRIDLRKNKISKLPEEMKKMKNLEYVFLKGNIINENNKNLSLPSLNFNI